MRMERFLPIQLKYSTKISRTSCSKHPELNELVKCFTTLSPNALIFFVEKMRKAFAMQKLLIFFNKKYWRI